MELWRLMLVPVVGFVIGYVTNYVAIRMLFRPRRMVWGVQGVIPKRKRVIAGKVSEFVIEVLPARIRDLERLPFVGAGLFDSVRKGIEKEIVDMDDARLEELVLKVVKRELRFITWVGGLLGFVIGLVQVGILLV